MEQLAFFPQYRSMGKGNQHGGRKYDDLQNLLDMTSHENPLLRVKPYSIFLKIRFIWLIPYCVTVLM